MAKLTCKTSFFVVIQKGNEITAQINDVIEVRVKDRENYYIEKVNGVRINPACFTPKKLIEQHCK